MKEPVFTGLCTAMITPFSENGIDFRRLSELLEHQEKHGAAAVLLAATTGESATLEQSEYEKLLDFSVRCCGGRLKVIAGIGGNNTASCLEKARAAENAGCDAVIMTTPYYNKSTQRGILAHFTHVADRIGLPLILYNIPSRAGIGIAQDTYIELSRHPNINGVKEASGDFSLIARTIAECGDELNVWSGNDDNTLPMMALGAKGVISVASNIIPESVSILCALCRSGDYAAAREVYCRYADFFADLFIETNPIPVKAAMSLIGLDSGRLRLPLVEISETHLKKLLDTMRRCGIVY